MLTQLHLARAILLRLLVSKLGVSMVTGATFARLLKGYKARADGRRAGGRAAGGHILLLGTWYQVPGTPCYQVPGATARYPVPGTGCQVPGTRYLVPDTWYLVPGTWYQVYRGGLSHESELAPIRHGRGRAGNLGIMRLLISEIQRALTMVTQMNCQC